VGYTAGTEYCPGESTVSPKSLTRHLFPALFCIGAAFPAIAQTQQVSAFTSGDLCAPVNVGKANRTIQNIRGKIVNTSDSEEIAVSCPLITFFPTTDVRVTAIVENLSDADQEAKCVLREVDFSNFVLTTTIQNLVIPTGASDGFIFDPVALDSPFNRLNLTCLLPPNSSLGGLMMDSL
jgi:hypothetical protein